MKQELVSYNGDFEKRSNYCTTGSYISASNKHCVLVAVSCYQLCSGT